MAVKYPIPNWCIPCGKMNKFTAAPNPEDHNVDKFGHHATSCNGCRLSTNQHISALDQVRSEPQPVDRSVPLLPANHVPGPSDWGEAHPNND